MITSLYAALIGFILVALSAFVIMGRGSFKIGLGYGDAIEMTRRIRAHSNLSEYAPLFLILLGFSEFNHLPAWKVHSFGIIFVLGRALHAYSILKHEKYDGFKLISKPIWRACGTACTLGSIFSLSMSLLISFLKIS
jgi:uncharacterized protein